MRFSLQLSDDCYLDYRLAQAPVFAPDEMEVWLHNNEKDICIFKDSKRYVLQVECRAVVTSIEKSIGPYLTTEDILSIICSFNDELFRYSLFEYRDMITTISPCKDEMMLICIIRYDLCNMPELFSSYVVQKDSFICWFNNLCGDD